MIRARAQAPLAGPLRPRLRRYQDLMRFRVRRILLVSGLYDSFILAEDGQLNEAILRQYIDLNLSQNPDLIRVSRGAEALALAQAEPFELILTSLEVGDMDAATLARQAAAAGIQAPVVLLAYNNRELTNLLARRDVSALDRVFLWQGDFRILIAMVKYVEDRVNAVHDAGASGVPVIIVVEDNVRYYSSFLPMIYSEITRYTQGLVAEGLNLSQKLLRMRARPKILLATTFEEAQGYFERYSAQVLGILSDIEYPRGGKPNKRAGFELLELVRRSRADVPIVLQSSFPENEAPAHAAGAHFLLKGSPVLLHDLRHVLREDFGFGDFVFRTANGDAIDRASDLKTLVQKICTVPAESIAYHGERNHFSNWLKARTELELAEALHPRRVSDFASLEHLRATLVDTISRYRRERDRPFVADFDRAAFERGEEAAGGLWRIGGGSLGGKARGMAFLNRLLAEYGVAESFPQVDVLVPPAAVLGTDVFDQFLDLNGLRGLALESDSDTEIWERFAGAPFPPDALADLRALLARLQHPLAVRSSGLLEDSPSLPFAGVYRTYMLPNNHPELETRLVQLVAAIKRVYASTFSRAAKDFLRMTPFSLEGEKMAVIVQRIVGAAHGNRFYPTLSGVARSHDFYPVAPLAAEDGVVAAALGLGRMVVDGGACVRFSPKYPLHQLGFAGFDEVLHNSQREFYALNLDDAPGREGEEGVELSAYPLQVAEDDGTLAAVGSTWSADNDAVYDGLARTGVRVVTLAPILKHGVFPLAQLLEKLLEIGTLGTNSPVEIEFAVQLPPDGGRPELGVLQMRPLALTQEFETLELGDVREDQVLVRSARVLGNGSIGDVRDVVVVDFHRFDRLKSHDAARLVTQFNAELQRTGTPYLLIGVGRWGSSDPHLGIPVGWNQIAGARVIVEAGFRDFKVTPSQGTHFFQNLTSCNVGYFTVNPEAGEGFVDWSWLAEHGGAGAGSPVRHLRLDAPLTIKMSGKTGEGIILKPRLG